MTSTNNQSNTEALQTLFHSFAGGNSQNVTSETIEQLSARLSELLGEGVVRDAFANSGMGAERFNEEGLPVVDITEPGSASVPASPFVSLAGEPDLVPFASLSPAERERKRKERDRILDLLEEEEELEKRKEEEREKQERLEAAEKRKEAAKLETERLKMARETQKKMGKALMKSISGDQREEVQETKETGTTGKKSVSFAADDIRSSVSQASEEIDWGHVAIGRLRTARQLPSLLSRNLQNEQLMKASVVERIPGVGRVSTVPVKNEQADSDDESDVDEASDGSVDEDNILEDEDFDADFAQQQREVALEYHRKRGKIGETAAAALISHSHPPEEDSSMDSSASKGKKSISNFRASQLASPYAESAPHSSRSQSLGGSVLPASATLQRSIRTGKLNSDQKLAGGDAGESDSEPENEAVQDMIELLQKGEVYNIGPNGDLHSVPLSPKKPDSSTTARSPRPFTPPAQPLPSKTKNSLFKLSRTQAVRSSSVVDSSPLSESATPISGAERSSPKLPAVGSSVVERNVSEKSTPLPPGSSSPIIIDSPSFQRPNLLNPMVIESSSFPQNSRSSSRPERPPEIMSANVRESVPKNGEAATGVGINGDGDANRLPKKVSRFKVERM